MSVPKINVINYCKRWIGVYSNFGDIEDQKKVWFRGEGSGVGSFDDDYESLDSVIKAWSEIKRRENLNKECNDLIQRFIDKFYEFYNDPNTIFILVDEESLYNDPRWLEIVKTAQEAKAALETYIQEVESDSKR